MILENRSRIITSAIEIFKNKGIVATTMTDIAREVNYDRRTLYRYFSNKDELVLEVVVSILKDWNEYQQQIFDSVKGTGLERFRAFYRQLLKKEDMIDLIVMVTEFDMIFDIYDFENRTEGKDLVASYKQEAIYPHALMRQLLTEGIKDGSMKQVKIDAVIPVFHNVLWSIMQKASISSRSINDILEIDFIEIIHEQIEMYVEYLRG